MATVLVTGGGGGIGAATVRRFARDGHAVAIGWAHHRDRAVDLAEELRNEGHDAHAVHCDVSDPDVVERAAAAIEDVMDPVTVLVNNGGLLQQRLVLKEDPDDWRRMIQTNLTGPFLTIKRFVPGMVDAGWGRVINVSSGAGSAPRLAGGAYGASKAGLEMLTRVLAIEVIRKGVTVNAVAPGLVLTDMTTTMGDDRLGNVSSSQAAARPVEADEVAAVIRFLASDDASMVNGQVIAVNGGGTLAVRWPERASTVTTP